MEKVKQEVGAYLSEVNKTLEIIFEGYQKLPDELKKQISFEAYAYPQFKWLDILHNTKMFEVIESLGLSNTLCDSHKHKE